MRYFLAAQALRAFSISQTTKGIYRKLGNAVGSRGRARGLPSHYLRRANENLRILEERQLIWDGAEAMEIGTGWAHWEALFTRCFYDVSVIAMDVWDNRQFSGFMRFASELKERLGELGRTAKQVSRATKILEKVAVCESFDDVYRELSFRYVLGAEEAYKSVPTETLDLIFSSDVLEHVPTSQVKSMLDEHYRMLRPGGVSGHQIVLTDHLRIYDRSVHPKNYLKFSERTWNLFYANDVQYINRLQMNNWSDLIKRQGFELETIVRDRVDLSGISISEQFRTPAVEDLDVAVVNMIAHKPIEAS